MCSSILHWWSVHATWMCIFMMIKSNIGKNPLPYFPYRWHEPATAGKNNIDPLCHIAIFCRETLDPCIHVDVTQQKPSTQTPFQTKYIPCGTRAPWWHWSSSRTKHAALWHHRPLRNRNVTKNLSCAPDANLIKLHGMCSSICCAVAMRGFAFDETMFGWVLWLEKHPVWMPRLRVIPSSTVPKPWSMSFTSPSCSSPKHTHISDCHSSNRPPVFFSRHTYSMTAASRSC